MNFDLRHDLSPLTLADLIRGSLAIRSLRRYNGEDVSIMSYDFFQNRSCPYFPCHPEADPDGFSCLFCYCPLYALGDSCGGSFTYTEQGIKDCSRCLRPHRRENYEVICEKLADVMELAKNN